MSFRLISVLIQYICIFTPDCKPVKENNYQTCRNVKGQQNLQKAFSSYKALPLVYMFNSLTLNKEMNKQTHKRISEYVGMPITLCSSDSTIPDSS